MRVQCSNREDHKRVVRLAVRYGHADYVIQPNTYDVLLHKRGRPVAGQPLIATWPQNSSNLIVWLQSRYAPKEGL